MIDNSNYELISVLKEISETLKDIKTRLSSIDDSIIGAGRVLTNFENCSLPDVNPNKFP